MKKIIVFVTLVILSLSFVQAQDKKPTKEETIAFLKKTIKGSNSSGTIISIVEFGDDEFTQTESANIIKLSRHYRPVKWENIKSVETGLNYPDDCIGIEVKFSSKLTCKTTGTIDGDPVDADEDLYAIHTSIPKSKFESVKKAFLHLAEIAKEENKDPFAN
jgi:hypothetical protein